jgi:hypothetical protein
MTDRELAHRTICFTLLGFQLNALLDHGVAADIVETHDHIEQGDIFDWLRPIFKSADERLDMSVYQEADYAEVIRLFQGLSNTADSRRKFGIENNGIALLVAYCFEGIQQLRPND